MRIAFSSTFLLAFSSHSLAQAGSVDGHRFTQEVITGQTESGEECFCEVEEGSNIVISRPDCDPNDVETCQANCANLHGVDNYLSDKCCHYVGQAASLLAFEEAPEWVPRIEEFNKCTGASVRLEYLPEGEDGMADALRADLGDDISHESGSAAGQGIFDAYIVQAPWLWPVVNGLENLTPRIRENADTVKFLDINAASRSAVSYNGTVRALPLDTDYIALGWRQDVFHKHGIPLEPPKTIQELAQLAKRLNGLDHNNDGEGDWGVCLTPQVNYFYAFVAPIMQTALEDPTTGTQTGQNMFFDSDTFEPLIHQPAFKAALELYWTIILNSNCQDQLMKGEKCDRKTAFPTGRCAMVISMPGTLTKMLLDGAKYAPVPRLDESTGQVEWDVNDEPLGTDSGYWGRRAAFPGSSQVQKWDAEAGYPLVSCLDNAQNCPLAEDGVNYAPFFAEGGEAYAINGRQAKPQARGIMWDLFTWLSELPVTELPLSGQYRQSHLTEEQRVDLTTRAGWPIQMVHDLFDVLGRYFRSQEEGGNPVQDLLMLGFPEYMDALDEELHDKFLGVKKDSTGGLFDRSDPSKSINPTNDYATFDAAFEDFVKALEARYNTISDNISGGQIGQLQRWRQSLNLPWRSDEELCVFALSSGKSEAFGRLDCPSIVDLGSLCRLQPEDVALYDGEICAKFIPVEANNNLAVLVPSIVVPAVLLVAIGAYVYIERKKSLARNLWTIKPSELVFDEPPAILGRGTFGLVLLAEYRGTQVAVKRVVRPKRDTPPKKGRRPIVDDQSAGSGTMQSLGSSSRVDDPFKSGSNRVKYVSKSPKKEQAPQEVNFAGNTHAKQMHDLERDGEWDFQVGLNDDIQIGLNDEEMGVNPADFEIALNDEDTGKPIDLMIPMKDDGDRSVASADSSDRLSVQSGSSFDAKSLMSMDTADFSASHRSDFNYTKSTGAGMKKSMFSWGGHDEHAERKADFVREMQTLAQLRHPCITTVMGAVIEKNVEPMLVMEYCAHGSLYDLIHNESMTLDGDVVLPILRDICQGLRFLHSSDPQIIHGDLKAANILVDARFRAKVADFGLSAKKTPGATGTPLWMAPELLLGESQNTTASDVYSFGITLNEVYSRKDPYQGEDHKTIIVQIAHPVMKKRPPIPQACPDSIKTIMTECWEANPVERPSFVELDMRLKRLSPEGATPQDSPYAAYSRKKREGKAETLLQNVFPPHIAEALREGRKVEKEKHECVTIFFSDIVGFTTVSAKIGPEKVADMLDRLYTKFDALSDYYEVFKIETIGDAYMAITNLVTDQKEDHVKRMVEFSTDAIKAAKLTLIDEEDPSLGSVEIRVGFHSGPVLSGVVGTRLPKYGVFGDTVNTASRMESNSKAMRIHCSKASAMLLKQQAPNVSLKPRGKIQVKGKELMSTYWARIKGSDVEHGEADGHVDGPESVKHMEFPVSGTGELVTLVELARLAKKSGMTLADFPNSHGARTLAELLSRNAKPQGDGSDDSETSDVNDNDSTDYFIQSQQNEKEKAEIAKIRQEVAARLGVRIAP